jgi:hypothetical protein
VKAERQHLNHRFVRAVRATGSNKFIELNKGEVKSVQSATLCTVEWDAEGVNTPRVRSFTSYRPVVGDVVFGIKRGNMVPMILGKLGSSTPAWTTVTLTSPLTTLTAVRHGLLNGQVFIDGSIYNVDDTASSVTLFTLPAGRRPLTVKYFPVALLQGTNGRARIQINTTGTVVYYRGDAASTIIGLDHISFWIS